MDTDGNLVTGNPRNNLPKPSVEGPVVNGTVLPCPDKWGTGISVLVGKEEVKSCPEDHANDAMGRTDHSVKEKCPMITMAVGYSEGVSTGTSVR